MTSHSNRLPVPRVAAASRQLGRDDATETLRQEAIDHCLQCARYTHDPEKSDLCIHWDTCEERLELFPSA
jgi:hypothetical protein